MNRFVAFLLFMLVSLSGQAQTCPDGATVDSNRNLIALLDYIAVKGGGEFVTVAECAATVYRGASLASFQRAHPTRTEQLIQEVTSAQRRAAERLEESQDIEGRDRFLRIEVALRRKVLEDIETLGDDAKSRLRLERVRQVTYLIQALDRGGDGQAIHQFLTLTDVDYFQPQVIDAWLRSLYSCPDWKLSKVGNLTDAELQKGVCQSACTPRARAALANIEDWRSGRVRDWSRSGTVKELHGRLTRAIASCKPE